MIAFIIRYFLGEIGYFISNLLNFNIVSRFRLNLLLGFFLVFLAQKDLENDITIWNHSRSQLAIGNFFFRIGLINIT